MPAPKSSPRKPAPKGSARSAAPDAASSAPSSSAERSLSLLALLAREGRALPLADLATRLGLPKATAHRMCTQLVESGYLARDIDQRFYNIGPALRSLAFDALNHGIERSQRHAILEALVKEVEETCNFTTLDGTKVLYLDRVEAHWPLRLTLDAGSHVPLHCTASGKLFLAMMDEDQRMALLSNLPLEALTRNTAIKPEALNKECKLIAGRGYSTDNEEFMAGLIAVAVPVRTPQGETRAAIAVHAPTARMSLRQAIARLPALKAAARKMGALL